MRLEIKHIRALDQAEALFFHSDFCPYFELKALLPDKSTFSRVRFRALFTAYYGLNVGGLTPEFKDRFFDILFSNMVTLNGQANYIKILTELSRIKRRKGDYAMPFSFVSKLVAMHDETSPVYDRHVLSFFGKKPPAATLENNKRIAWFVEFLEHVRNSYNNWGSQPPVAHVLSRFKSRDPQLEKCHLVRLMDFLVWKVGNRKLLITS